MHCKDATRALSAAQEAELGLGERLSLRLHLSLCANCRAFERQVDFLRESMRAYARRPDDVDDGPDGQSASRE
jgi:Putative zinc-finger